MTRKTDLRISKLLERIGLKVLLTVGVMVGGLCALPGTVYAANTPNITSGPSDLDLTYGYGQYYKLTVEATVENPAQNKLTYQWYEEGTAIPGATSATYNLPTGKDATDDNIGFYCVVTATNTDGSTASAESRTATVSIRRRGIGSAYIDVYPNSFTYDGTTKGPQYWNLFNKEGFLEEDYDYEIEGDSVFAAKGSPNYDTTYSIKIRGLGNYKGTTTATWTIKASSGGGSGGGTGGGSGTPVQPSAVTPATTVPASSPAATVPSSVAPSTTSSVASSAASKDSLVDSFKSALAKVIDSGIVDKVLEKLADDTKLANSEDALKSIVGEKELSSLKAEGKTPEVKLDTKVIDKVSEDDKKLTESSISKYSSVAANLTPGAFLDINLKLNTSGDWQNVVNTKEPIKVVINVPEEMQKVSDKFYVLRIHNGVSTLLYDKDEDPKTVTIDSDQFSTYVLMYPGSEATAVKTGELKSRENTPFILWMIVGITIASIMIFLVVFYFFYIPSIQKKRNDE